MTQKELQLEYDKYSNSFDKLKKEIESNVVRTENYKGEFYEISPFSYQRGGFKQGKPIDDVSKLKKTKDLFTYSFNSIGNIIAVREGIDLNDKFYYEFLFHEEGCIKSFNFHYDLYLRNISYYFIGQNGNIIKKCSIARMGGREEDYQYNDGILNKIVIRQFDDIGEEGPTLIHLFDYNLDGSLKTITKTPLDNNYSEIIYK